MISLTYKRVYSNFEYWLTKQKIIIKVVKLLNPLEDCLNIGFKSVLEHKHFSLLNLLIFRVYRSISLPIASISLTYLFFQFNV